MSVRVQLDEEKGIYALGDDVEGVFIEFVTLPKTSVDSRIAAVLEHQDAAGTTQATPSAAKTDAGDYVDNGDGTWTRSSDGAQGHFTPAGFTPSASS
jgi:hypothetical protein